MESTTFTVSYDGPALESHSMDVKDLAPALMNLAQLFEDANKVLNGNDAQIRLNIKAAKQGSFQIDFEAMQSVMAAGVMFLSGEHLVSILNLKELLFGDMGLIKLLKFLKGQKPDKVEKAEDGKTALISVEAKTINIKIGTIKLGESIPVREALEGFLKPVQQDGIDSLSIKNDSDDIEEITKNELPWFEIPFSDSEILESIKEGLYKVRNLAFAEGNKWTLYDGAEKINVIIRDTEFLKKVDEDIISFAKNDMLRCSVKTTQWVKGGKLNILHEVLEVLEHRPAARQIPMFLN